MPPLFPRLQWLCAHVYIVLKRRRLKLQVKYFLNQKLKINHDQNLKPNRKQNSQHMLRLLSVSCNLCQLTKGSRSESLCQIQTLPKCLNVKVQKKIIFFFLKHLEIFQETYTKLSFSISFLNFSLHMAGFSLVKHVKLIIYNTPV
jgi:hypothetical protein